MGRQLTRDEKTPVLIYKGPATAYKEDVKKIAEKKGYRLVDSRGIRKSFTKKMLALEAVLEKAGEKKKLMFVEGKDVNLFTPKPKEVKEISKTREQRAIESTENIAKAVEAMTKLVAGQNINPDIKKQLEENKVALEALTKSEAEKSELQKKLDEANAALEEATKPDVKPEAKAGDSAK